MNLHLFACVRGLAPKSARHRLARWLPLALCGLAVLGLAAWLGLTALVDHTAVPNLQVPTSTLVLDRDGRLLRPFTVDRGRWRLPLDLAAVDPRFIKLLLAVEDRRFYSHHGVDPLALVRAATQLATRGLIVSGGSTLTMQLARLLDGGGTRSAAGKVRQALGALALERNADKAQILAAYLTVAPYGGNLEGLRAGSLAWFGKEPKHLTTAEAAFLVALPQAPEARRPDRDPAAARRARDRVLGRALALGLIDAQAATAARREPVPTARRPFPMLAPHLGTRLALAFPGRSVHRTTLDTGVQGRLETLAADRASAIDPRVSVAVLVADHGNGEVLATVGSAGLFDGDRQGHVDMTRALRSPGSTLKPLIYGLAFESGIAHPESLIEDRPTAFAGYVPGNFDRSFQGTVTVRRALALSLNVPAVQLLDAVGPARLLARMRRAGAAPVLADGAPPGLAIGLGGLGLSLFDLVRIYAAIARGGESLDLHETLDGPAVVGPGRRVLEERAAWYLTSILSEVPAPNDAAPQGISYKTGTSYGYRDAWAIGYDGRRVVGVWVGRPDGAPVPGLKGVDMAVPILLDAFTRLGPRSPLPSAPPGALMAATNALPPTLRHARVRDAGVGAAPAGPEIAFPPDGARLDVGFDQADRSGATLALKVRNGHPPFTWFADGRPIGQEPFARTIEWQPAGPGYAAISVVDGRGRSSRVRVYLR
ncbi:penicillin-binding protein 1C [uncultured Thiodictyon sp.]|uniref:penicillin-binding protein 1C n=1 Tax=uncultured Thiodictyon sp. TaxID=1846217 RepID=UPI0025F88456|nr:penicillin-binding protein 1C [uncultured Thiodictyon sp.]